MRAVECEKGAAGRGWDPVNRRCNPAHTLKTAKIFDFLDRMAIMSCPIRAWVHVEGSRSWDPHHFVEPARDVRIKRRRRQVVVAIQASWIRHVFMS